MEWLSHSNKKHCELCKTPFRFTKLYDAQMPDKLPWGVFVRRACVHVVKGVGRVGRVALVMTVWLALVPWFARWVWRWLFWLADAAWAREGFLRMMVDAQINRREEDDPTGEWSHAVSRAFRQALPNDEGSEEPLSFRMAKILFGFTSSTADINATTATTSSPTFQWPQADPSLLSTWPQLSNLTTSPSLNRLLLDILEGQLITFVVITAFILVFLIREWVVQQQPIVNLDALNLPAQQEQVHELRAQARAAEERLQREREVLEAARVRLDGLRREADEVRRGRFVGWEGVEEMLDRGVVCLRKSKPDWQDGADQSSENSARDYADFVEYVREVGRQFRFADEEGFGGKNLMKKIQKKVEEYDVEEKVKIMEVISSELVRSLQRNAADDGDADASDQGRGIEQQADSSRRPPMPARDFSSRAAEVRRSIEEARDEMKQAENAVRNIVSGASETNVDDTNRITSALDSSPARAESNTSSWFDPIPITNAGPDAKVNITRRGKGKMRRVPEPKAEIGKKMVDHDEELSRLNQEVEREIADESAAVEHHRNHQHRHADAEASPAEVVDEQPEPTSSERVRSSESTGASANANPFHPDGHMPPERRNSESFSNRVASVFREEFGLDDADGMEEPPTAQPGEGPESGNESDVDSNRTNDQEVERRPHPGPRRIWGNVADWFWGDLETPGRQSARPTGDTERRIREDETNAAVQDAGANLDPPAQEAPFVPIHNGHPVRANNNPAPPPAPQLPPHQDPEVIAAAQAAGLDPEAIDDAEDLEGLFELLGLQGPLIGLFQIPAFCMLLVACTILGAVVGPYLFGKIVLSLIGDPVFFCVKMPLTIAGWVADLVVDLGVLILAYAGVIMVLAVDFLVAAIGTMLPSSWSFHHGGWVDTITEIATSAATKSMSRLQGLVETDEPVGQPLMRRWAFLTWSMHSHGSLRNLQEEFEGLSGAIGAGITAIVETISEGRVLAVCGHALGALRHLPQAPAKVLGILNVALDYLQPVLDFGSDLFHGTLHVSSPTLPSDPTLVYWNTTDRALAITTGYIALAVLAALYVAADTPLTSSESGRRTEKQIRDALRQAGGVLKVILIISIEMLVFPLYCGMLLDLAFLPLFPDANVASRWAWAGLKPYTFCFVHWFVGTCYMFHFALFVGMCRKILRKGVLWFVRDPDDPTFHPVRDVLERNVATQLRKIAFSALVYGALVILCLGGVVWTTVQVCASVFPIRWASAEPVLEFPFNLFLFNFITPVVLKLFRPTDAVGIVYGWWLRRCARALRLSHFLFDDRRKDEEGWFEYGSMLARLTAERPEVTGHTEQTIECGEGQVKFHRDGKYTLTPSSDQYRPPKAGEAFLYVEDDDVYIADKDGKKNEQWSKVYVPPLFRLRVSLFMGCLWLFSAVVGLGATIIPLVVGRKSLTLLIPEAEGLNDIYAFSFGAYLLGGLAFIVMKGKKGTAFLKSKAKAIDAGAWVRRASDYSTKTLRCLYVYGFVGIIVPMVISILMALYIAIPLQTWLDSEAATNDTTTTPANNSSSVSTSPTNLTTLLSSSSSSSNSTVLSLTTPTFHVLQGYALGLVWSRLFVRLLLSLPTSRAAAAFRLITAPGYFNPNPVLATRYLILPFILLATILLLIPPATTKVALVSLRNIPAALSEETHSWLLDAEVQTKFYRYSYPLAASAVMLGLAVAEVMKATERWRARIKDEVYLVGERLHNFGEKRPPAGSRSVVRKERA